MAYETISFSTRDGIATLMLNRPQVMNALNTKMRAEISEALNSIGDDVRCVVMTGAGPAFCSGQDLTDAGYEYDPHTLVLKRAEQARIAGMGGVVCSAEEASAVRQILGPKMAIVTPGIRPAGADHDDQKRVLTPLDAIRAGSSQTRIANGCPPRIWASATPGTVASRGCTTRVR